MGKILIQPGRSLFFCLIILFFSIRPTSAQTTQFRKYVDTIHKFSFDLPSHWAIKYSDIQHGIICIPITSKEKEIYKDCFEGIVFRMEFFNTGLDSTLTADGNYTKLGNNYYTMDRFDSVEAKNIQGKTWTGIYHNNVCGISCKSNGFHAAAGQCEFMYFSNGNITVLIGTNGRALDDNILKRLLNSFNFNQ